MKLILAAATALAASVFACAPASAQINSCDAPIEVSSLKDLVYSRAEGTFSYSDNVRVIQCGSQITTDKLTIYCDRPAGKPSSGAPDACDPISRIVADGKVIYATPNEKIRGDHAEYDYGADTITITGDVIMARGDEGVVRGTKVVYQVGKGLVTITSDDKRVFSIFNTRKPAGQTPAAATPPAPAAPAPRPN